MLMQKNLKEEERGKKKRELVVVERKRKKKIAEEEIVIIHLHHHLLGVQVLQVILHLGVDLVVGTLVEVVLQEIGKNF
jgi:hypothetical protein